MHWELWDTETANLVGDYATEAEALAVVREALQRHGAGVVETLALGAEHDLDNGDDAVLPPVVRGAELIDRARSAGQPKQPA